MIARVESWIGRSAESFRACGAELALIRVAFGVCVILFGRNLSWVDDVPAQAFHAPAGPFSLVLDGPPGPTALTVLHVVQVLLAGMVILGVFTRFSSIALTLVLVTASAITYSYAKVDHFILFEIAPVFLAYAGWGSRFSIDARRRGREGPTSGFAVLLFALVVGWGMLSASVPKALGGWLDPDRLATKAYVARDLARADKEGPLGRWMLENIGNDGLWKLLDYATLAAEGMLVLWVLVPIVYRIWVCLLLGFHVGVYLSMGINFAEYLLVYAVFLIPVASAAIRRGRRGEQVAARGTISRRSGDPSTVS